MAYDQSTVTISAVLEDNFALGHGGGLASIGASSILLRNGVIFRNNNAFGNGGCLFAAGSKTTIGEFNVAVLVYHIAVLVYCIMVKIILGQSGHLHLRHASVTGTVVQSMLSLTLHFKTTGIILRAHFSRTKPASVVEPFLPGETHLPSK